MKVDRVAKKGVKFDQFADQHQLTLRLVEDHVGITASFVDVEGTAVDFKPTAGLNGSVEFGRGVTEVEAAQNLAESIQGKIMILRGQRIEVPELLPLRAIPK